MSIIQGNAHTSAGGGGYQIERSLRFNSADSAYLNRTPASAGSRTTWTWSGWVKRGALGSNHAIISCGSYSTDLFQFYFEDATNSLRIQNFPNSTTANVDLLTSAVYRDLSAWYHIVAVMDTTQATSSNRVKLYVNGSQVTAFSTATYPAQNATPNWNTGSLAHLIGARSAGVLQYAGYLTEVNFIDGQALTPSSFGETDSNTGVWKPKAFSGTYGTNGFYLKFADNSGTTSTTLGKDSSGNGNNWTPNNFSVTAGAGNDSLVDSPTSYGTDTGVGGEVRGNYATLNPFQLATSGALFTLANGNLDYSCSASTGNAGRMYCEATMALHSGKSYWEIQVTNTNPYIGVISEGTLSNGGTPNGNTGVVAVYSSGQAITGTSTATYSGTTFTFTTNDIIGFAWDGTALTLGCYKNGSLIGTWSNFESTKTWFPVIGVNSSSSSTSAIANFGQRAFAYTAPSGFKALCTQNLPTPTIGATSTTQANDYFDAVTWTGNGTYPRNITCNFSPDLVWTKARNQAWTHNVFDSVRGTGNSKYLVVNATNAEGTYGDYANVSAFNADGFQIGSTTLTNVQNDSSGTFVGWLWRGSDSSAVTNTAGTITSTVSANTTSGFSIVTYTGTGANATVGHGLGVTPSMVIVKRRSGADAWYVHHANLTSATFVLQLNSTIAQTSIATIFNSTAPTSTVFSVGTDSSVNASSSTYVAYCFANVEGYSRAFSYTGNGSSDGPFVYTGFRPRFVLIKNITTAGTSWEMFDAARETENLMDLELLANSSNAEGPYTFGDFVSNGFKLRSTNNGVNQSTATLIYAAFAENPFKYSLAR